MKFLVSALTSLCISVSFGSEKNNTKHPHTKPKYGRQCVNFNGTGAKKTFVALYPFTQGKVTAISADGSKLGETSILTANIFCRVWTAGLSQNFDSAMAELKKIIPSKFQCGYFISSEGNLTPCREDLRGELLN